MSKYPVIIDCDPGIDDSLALLLAMLSPEIELLGISVSAGNVDLPQACLNAKRMVSCCQKEIPIIPGAAAPLVKEPTYAYETHGRDGFGEIGRRFDQTFGAPKAMAWPGSLLDFYQAQTKKQSNIVLICLGPLTNLAHLLQEDQTMVASFDRIISMGGSYKSHGNASPVAEFNYWFDPEAAAYVYENAPRPIEMVGLDVTRPILLNAERLDKWKAAFGKIGDFIEALTAFYSAFHKRYEGIEGCVINDPLAVACLLDDQLLQGFSSYVDIESHGKARGASIVDAYDFYRRQPNALVYTEVNPDRFFELYQSLVETWT